MLIDEVKRTPSLKKIRVKKISGIMIQTTPEVKWAQRSSSSDPEKNVLYLTLVVPDVSDPVVNITETTLTLDALTKDGSIKYCLTLYFYKDVEPENYKLYRTDRCLALTIRKKEADEKYWPRLIQSSDKFGYIRTDFDKWVDEDEQNARPGDDFSSQFGGMGDFDFNKFSDGIGSENMPKLDDIDSDDDSDIEEDSIKDDSNEDVVSMDKD
ncbi:hypothetical protein PNEG_01036 [Pneumocystis murina B123]|uniref:CS domain-containing protein n=1 Tax=Pneumocystis murina (strain B123) TaxID=1069680 RepID=M7PAL0_PNEMU|nr:hypothetical protein PNEG_01036 [Pneumocystis murina B123]EMR10890.1 hypothetical protein PNEG_01036 [Pneumocystis murina B123]